MRAKGSFMPHCLGAFLISCLLVLSTVPLLRRIAIRNGVLDHPDGRKVHKNDTPRIGGAAIVLAFFLAIGFVLLWSEPSKHTVSLVGLVGLCIGGAIVTFSNTRYINMGSLTGDVIINGRQPNGCIRG